MNTAIKKKSPQFSVITVTKDNLTGLEKTYASLIEQDFHDYEWIVINGEENGPTSTFLKEQRNKLHAMDIAFRFINEKDRSIFDAMNKGISFARGKYLIFMNAGDEFAEKSTLRALNKVCDKSPDFIYADALEPLKNGKTHYKKARDHNKKELGMFTHHQAMLYKRRIIRDNKMHYSLLYKVSSDYDFTLRFLEKTQKCSYYSKAICKFEQGGLSQKNTFTGRREQFIIRERLNIVSRVQNVIIFAAQSLAWAIRYYLPALYFIFKS